MAYILVVYIFNYYILYFVLAKEKEKRGKVMTCPTNQWTFRYTTYNTSAVVIQTSESYKKCLLKMVEDIVKTKITY